MNGSADPALAGPEFQLLPADFERIRKLICQRAGISLHSGKQAMVYSRLSRRLRLTQHRSFTDYLSGLKGSGSAADAAEWQQFVNCLSTHLTAFCREDHHFAVLAQDLRSRARGLSAERLKRHFLRGTGGNQGQIRVKPELARMIDFCPVDIAGADWAELGEPFGLMGTLEQMWLCHFAHPPWGADDIRRRPGGAHKQMWLGHFASPPRGGGRRLSSAWGHSQGNVALPLSLIPAGDGRRKAASLGHS